MILNIILIAIIAILIIGMIINKKMRLAVQKYILKAELNSFTKKATLDMVEKVQRSDLDERMVIVIAATINKFPYLNIIPKKLLIDLLKKFVQNIFDQVKDLLKAEVK